MDGWMDGWMDVWLSKCMCVCLLVYQDLCTHYIKSCLVKGRCWPVTQESSAILAEVLMLC